MSSLEMSSLSLTDDEDFVQITSPPAQSTSTPAPFVLPKLNGHNVYELRVAELQYLYSINAFTITEYTQFCLDHIQRTNPYLEAIIETNPDALSIASQLEASIAAGHKPKSALHGVPILIKDTMATLDRMQTTAGSFALLGSTVPCDAFIVSRLRAAGAILLGKTNLDEWAGMRCKFAYSTGFSARGGQCRNPYMLSREASGSSSGSAVAISANVVPISFGTETDTSIIGPALVCGVVGIKPTVGLTSRNGIVPISSTQDSVGPFGRTVADAVLGLDVIAARDPEDASTMVSHRTQPESYAAFSSDRRALEGAKFGLPMKRFWDVAPQPQRRVVERLLVLLKQAGAEVVEVDMPCAEERIHEDGHWDWTRYSHTCPERSELTVSKVQTYNLMKKYLGNLENTTMKTLEDLVRYNDENTGSEGGRKGTHPAFTTGQDLFRECVDTKGLEDKTYWNALKWTTDQCREKGIDAALKTEDGDFDGLLFCDVKLGGTCIAAQAGYPIIAVPVGLDPDGMPVGITLVHTKWEEAKLVKWASAIEDLLEHQAERLSSYGDRNEAGSGEVEFQSSVMGRVPPTFKEHTRKNVPVDYGYVYEGAPMHSVAELPCSDTAR